MRNILLPIAFCFVISINANANKDQRLHEQGKMHHGISAKAILDKQAQKMDSQFYANNAWLKAASYPSQKLTYYWNDTTSDWGLTLRNLFEYDQHKNIIRNEYIDATGITNFVYLYEYTNDNKQASITQQTRFNNPTGQLQFSSREEMSYDASGMLVQRLIKKWDANTSTWVEDQRAVIAYDAQGLNTEYRIDQKIAGVWVTQYGYQAVSKYQNNKIVELTYLGYYPDVSRFDTNYKLVYQYSNNLLSAMEHHNYDKTSEVWNEVERTEINYTADTATRILFYMRNGNQWELNSASDSMEWYVWTGDYNSSENVYKKYISQVWHPDSNKLWNVLRTEIERVDANGTLNLRQYEWVNKWDLRNIHHIGYDAEKNLIENTSYSISGMQMSINFSALYTNTYDQDNHLISMVQELYDTRNLQYVNVTKISFSNFVGIDQNTASKSLAFYPNPSQGNLRIVHNFENTNADESVLKIYSLDGKLVAEYAMSNTSNYTDIKIEKAGMYVLRCGEYVGKVLIE